MCIHSSESTCPNWNRLPHVWALLSYKRILSFWDLTKYSSSISRRWTSCLPGRRLHPPSLSSLRPVSVIQHPDCLRSSMPGHAHNTIHDGVIIPEKVCHPTPETLAPVNTIQFIFSLGFRWAAINYLYKLSHFSPVLFSRGHLISSNLWLCGEKCHQVTQETRTETKAPPDPPHWCVISWRMCDVWYDSCLVSSSLIPWS